MKISSNSVTVPQAFLGTRDALTMSELLNIIATIALLWVALFPVFGRGPENARRSACQSNSAGGNPFGLSAAGQGFTPRHREGANFLAADGHVKWLKPEDVSVGRPAWGVNPATKSPQSTGNPCGAEGTGYDGADKHAMTMSPI